MGIIAQSMAQMLVQLLVTFGCNRCIYLFIVLLIQLFYFFGHKANGNMSQEKAFSNEIWRTHALNRWCIPEQAAILDTLDALSYIGQICIGSLPTEVLLHIELNIVQFFQVCRFRHIIICHEIKAIDLAQKSWVFVEITREWLAELQE